LHRELGGGKAGVDGCVLHLKVEKQTIVQTFLDVERDLNTGNEAIVGEINFDRNVEKRVVVRVDVVGNGGRENGFTEGI
jgi:hypothetical protein